MLSIIGLITSILPQLATVLGTYLAAQTNAKATIVQAQTGAARDVAVAQLNARASLLSTLHDPWIPRIFGLIAAAYFAKCVVYDTMFGLGSTPELHGVIGWTYTTIVGCQFLLTGASMFRSSPK